MTDYGLFVIALAALGVVVFWLAVAARRHEAHVRAVPIRIHVSGTRGKSTTTRLIAAALRAGGLRVVAKTTGSEARLIRPDGGEEEWPRRGPAAIREQARLFAYAARMGADAVVVECMAIRPEMIWASESYLVRATTAVITNARADHVEDVGDAPDAMAAALAWVTPAKGRLVVSAEAASPALRDFAAARGAHLAVVDTEGLDGFAADKALAMAVAADCGIDAAIAAPAMEKAVGDPGVYFEQRLTVAGKPVRFANAFACNDVESLAQQWRGAIAPPPPVVLLNARRDRPARSRRFVDFLAAQRPPPILFVTGDGYALRYARRTAGANARRLSSVTPSAALAELAAAAPSDGLIWGVGNYHGFGARLVSSLAGADKPC